jgi:hypothetical protein
MAGSSASVNYSIRPCKSIERKMMCEMISRLTVFGDIRNYRYIGMGAKYFVDFSLLHKEFGISDMYSMEISSAEKTKKRFEFNKPFNCIKMLFGNSSDLLNSSKIEWKNEKNIIWLDYDGGIKSNQIQDVESCIGKVESGSVVFVSFNADLGDEFKESSPKKRLEIYCSRIDNEILVKLLTPQNMAKGKIYQTTNQMFDNIVKNKISERNSTIIEEDERLFSNQLVYFKYNDSKATMLTLGWIVYKRKDIEKFEKCSFSDFEFYNDTDKPFDITVPNFTYKELAILNQNMPKVTYPIEGADFFEEEEVNAYRKIYKYYPTTFETSIAL